MEASQAKATPNGQSCEHLSHIINKILLDYYQKLK